MYLYFTRRFSKYINKIKTNLVFPLNMQCIIIHDEYAIRKFLYFHIVYLHGYINDNISCLRFQHFSGNSYVGNTY